MPTPAQKAILMSETAYGESCGGNFSTFGAAYTDGSLIIATSIGLSLAGLLVWWDGAGSRTVRCSLWDGTTTARLTFTDMVMNTAGTYVVMFGAPQPLTPFVPYRISKHDQDAAHEWYATSANISTQSNGLLNGASFHCNGTNIIPSGTGWVRIVGCFSPAPGDVFPASNDVSDIFFVDPIIV